MRVAPLLLAIAVGAAACGDRGPLPRKVANDSVSNLLKTYAAQVEQAQQANALKDSAMAQLTTATKLMDQLGDIERDMGVRSKTPAPETGATWDAIARKRLETIQKRFVVLNREASRLKGLTKENTAMRAQLDSLIALSGEQGTRIGGLVAQLDSLTAENQRLASSNSARADTIKTKTDQENTVYYVVGTKNELMQKGVVREVGGSRALLVARIGKALAPARVLPTAQFQVADMRTLKEIPLDANRYEVVTPQDLKYAAGVDEKGRYITGGKLAINDTQFWTNSRYLILVKK